VKILIHALLKQQTHGCVIKEMPLGARLLTQVMEKGEILMNGLIVVDICWRVLEEDVTLGQTFAKMGLLIEQVNVHVLVLGLELLVIFVDWMYQLAVQDELTKKHVNVSAIINA